MTARTDEIRAAVRAVLDDTAPRPWFTPDLQAGFSPVHRQRVYNALRQLVDRGQALCFRELDGCWWTSTVVTPRCLAHNRTAVRLFNYGGTGRAAFGGWVCDRAGCVQSLHDQRWPETWWNDRARYDLQPV